MKRLIEKQLIDWKNKENRKPLLLQGARQVGKTYVLQKFGNEAFRNTHYFDLEAFNMLATVPETSAWAGVS